MRKTLLGVMALIVALALPAAASANTQKIDAKISPSKLMKKKFKPTSVNVITTAGPDPGRVGPNAVDGAYRAKVWFDKDIKFFTKGVPQCKAAQVDGVQDPKIIKSQCGKSQVGSGKGLVALGGYVDPVTGAPPPANVLTADIYALNSVPKGGKPVILLHSVVPGVSATTLIGTLKKQGGKYKTLLDVAIEPLPGGTAILRFQAKIKKKYKYKGKKRSYVSAKCSHKKFFFKGTFFFEKFVDPTQKSQASATKVQRCKGKK